MKTNAPLPMIAALCLGSVVSAFAEPKQDELKQRVLAQAQSLSADDYAFTRTVRVEQTANGKTEKKALVDKFDPTKSGEARWTLVSVDNAAPSADDLNQFRKESAKRPVPGYYRLANYLGSPATVSTDSSGRTVFHLPALPKGTVLVMNSDISQSASADVSVSEANGAPFAEQVHLSVKPTRIKLLMKLASYESTARYRIGPEGKPLLIEQVADMSGSGMGQEGKAHTVITYSDYRMVR